MKVAHLFHAYLNTTENWCYRLIAHLRDVHIIIVTDTILNREKFPLPSADFSTPWYTRQIFSDSPLIQRVVKSITRVVWARFTLTADLEQTELLHAHFATIGWYYLSLRRKLHIPLIVSFYGYDYEWLPLNHPEWQKRYEVLFDEAALFLAEGCAGREKLIRMGCPEYKVQIARLGVNVKEIPFALRHKKTNSLRLVQVASFTEKKGHTTTVRAFARVAALYTDLHLTLVGMDPSGLRVELEEIIAEFGIANRVAFVDGIDFARLHDYLQDFHVFYSSQQAQRNRRQRRRCALSSFMVPRLQVCRSCQPSTATFLMRLFKMLLGFWSRENDYEGLAEAIGRFYRMEETEYHCFCRNARRHIQKITM